MSLCLDVYSLSLLRSTQTLTFLLLFQGVTTIGAHQSVGWSTLDNDNNNNNNNNNGLGPSRETWRTQHE